MGKRFVQRPLTEEELKENAEAMIWLRSKGLTPYEIKYFKWQYFNVDGCRKTRDDYGNVMDADWEEEGKITITRTTKRGRCYCFKISYIGTPLEVISRREHGRNLFVFHKETLRPSWAFPYGERYTEDEIYWLTNRAITTRKKRKKSRKKLLTIPAFLVQLKYAKHF